MKKITLLLIALIFSLSGYSQLALENFEGATFPPTGWNTVHISPGAEVWDVTLSGVCFGAQSAFIDRENLGPIGNNSKDYLTTPLFTVPANGQLKFSTRSSIPGDTGTLYQVRVSTAANGQSNTAGFTLLQTYTENTLSASVTVCEEKTINLTAFIGQQIYISFVKDYTQTVSGPSGDSWILDNVRVVSQCLNPTVQTAIALSTSATLGWTNTGGATSFQIENILNTATPTGVATATSTTNSFNQTGLTPVTSYKFYVRGLCANGEFSAWVGPFSYVTSTAPPVCGGNFVDDAGPTTNYANSSDSTVTICPVNAGDKVTVTFTSFNTEANWDGLYVFNGNAITSPQIASTNPAGNVPGGLAGAYWGPVIPGPFTSTAVNGCLTFRFRSDASINFPGWIANVTCAPPPTCLQPLALTTTAITATTATLGWTNQGTATSWQVLVQLATLPAPTATTTGWTSTTTNPFLATGLIQNTNYAFYVRGNCGAIDGVSLWSGPRAFTTPATCPVPTALITSIITPTSVTLSWTNTSTATVFEVLALPCAAPAPTATSTGFVSGSGSPRVITGLTPSTCYNFYVRGVCSATDSSVWSVFGTATTPAPPPACGGNFYDNGGLAANYLNSSDSTITICPTTPGQLVTVTFSAFDTEATWDGLYVFDGNSITAPQIATTNGAGNVPGGLAGSFWGSLTGTNLPGPFTSSATNGCLTFRFRSDASINNPGWAASVTCAPPPTCTKPTTLTATAITQTTATLGWTQLPNPGGASTATAWEILVLPLGSPIPTGSGIPITTNPYLATGLTAGTGYVFYVRAVCSPTDTSLWSAGFNFYTTPSNDECANAITVPVNLNLDCGLTTTLSLVGATLSINPNTCSTTATGDLWYQFTASANSHLIIFTNATNPLFNFAIYSGTCTSLTQVFCFNTNEGIASGLTIGSNYFIRVYSGLPVITSSFVLCIGTLQPFVTANTAQYTTQQLVQNILLNSTCATVSNITSSTGTNFGSTNGIGYFTQNNSSFPFSDGIILSTGNAASAPGPNNTTLGDGNVAWIGDTELNTVINAAGFTLSSQNATKLEFDFVPISNTVSFDYIFASEEYGTFQCTFSDSFAFLLTNTVTGVTTNLAVLPGTTIPISVVSVRNNLYNNGCVSVNPQFFGQYNLLPGINPIASPINFNGQTTLLTATSPVIANTLYHIKLVIADQNDSLFDSAVFLKGSSFGIGNLNIGNNLLLANGTALCAGSSRVLNTGLSTAIYSFTWKKDGVIIAGQTGPSLTVTVAGTYTVDVLFIGSTCTGSDSIVIEYYNPITAGNPVNLNVCNATAIGTFNLTQNNAALLTGLGSGHTVKYFLNSLDANNNTNPILNPTAFVNITNPQNICARIQNTVSGCFSVKCFDIKVLIPDFEINGGCQNGAYKLSADNLINVLNPTYAWRNISNSVTNVIASTPSVIITNAGTYTCTISDLGCNTVKTLVVNNIACGIQKGISPNLDGINDSFDLSGLDVKHLSIFNRYGIKVYSYTTYTNQWRGQSDKGEILPDGTYYYIIDLANGESKTDWVYINKQNK
jgi:gliding motility-associated-like protein